MYPIIHLGPLTVPSYGTMILIGLIIGIFFAAYSACRYQVQKIDIVLSTILASAGMIAGAKILYMITVIPNLSSHFDYVKTHIPETISYLFGGYVFYGGLIGALLMYLFFCRRMEYDFLRFTNIIAPVIPLVHGFGRIGCFLGGCCYGIEYSGPLAVTYPHNDYVEGLGSVSRFPVQLLEALINLVLFLFLFFYAKKPRKDGSLLGIYLICYSVIRFSLEFLRGDVERGILLGISTSQWISLFLIPLGIFLLKKGRKQPMKPQIPICNPFIIKKAAVILFNCCTFSIYCYSYRLNHLHLC